MERGALQAMSEVQGSCKLPVLIFRLLLAFCATLPSSAQVNTGELRLIVTDVARARLKALVIVSGQSNAYHKEFQTDERGSVDITTLPYGL